MIRLYYLEYILLSFYFLFGSTALGIKEALGEQGINAYAVHEKGITGAGVNIALLSNGNIRDGHAAFERSSGSAVKNYDFTGSGLSRSSHDTHMAGIILSAGSANHPDQIGIAPGARLHSGRFSNKNLYQKTITRALDDLITRRHCRIIMTGIQLPKDIVPANGDSKWTQLYDYYAETYDVIITPAAGNSAGTITVFGDGYNGITTAGLVRSDPNGPYDSIGTASNPGPTTDGRKKPELCAPTQGLTAPTGSGDDLWKTLDPTGRGLTSYAIPHTAGVAALLFEAAAKSTVENDDRTEVIKAVIINSADPSAFLANGSIASSADSITSWNPKSGYGKLDALKAYNTLMGGPITPNTLSKKNLGWAYGVMNADQEHIYRIQGKPQLRLVVTVTWHRKLKRIETLFLDESPRFQLNLKIVSPSGNVLSFETAGKDNLIKTDILLKEDGPYLITLKNPTSAKERDYGMALELLPLENQPSNIP